MMAVAAMEHTDVPVQWCEVRHSVARLPMELVRRALRLSVRVGEDEAMASLVWFMPERVRRAVRDGRVREMILEALAHRVSPERTPAIVTTASWTTQATMPLGED
jgi:hypothetical protein